jgi:hypothetical protein
MGDPKAVLMHKQLERLNSLAFHYHKFTSVFLSVYFSTCSAYSCKVSPQLKLNYQRFEHLFALCIICGNSYTDSFTKNVSCFICLGNIGGNLCFTKIKETSIELILQFKSERRIYRRQEWVSNYDFLRSSEL